MRAVPARDVGDAWDVFVMRRGGWFWHTSGWAEYQRAYYGERGDDLSFAVLDDDDAIAGVVPLYAPRDGSGFSYCGRPLPAPIFRDQRSAKFGCAAVAQLRRDAPWFCEGAASPTAWSRLWSASRSKMRRVDLTGGGPDWSAVRSSYRSLIHRAERDYEIESVHGEAAEDAFAAYQVLHQRCYDSPRPAATYRLQAKWAREGRALVTSARLRGTGAPVGAAYWFVQGDRAYYGSGVYAVRDVSHAVVWRSLLKLRDDFAAADLGYVGEATDDKGRAIEFFKRGFGGSDVDVLRWVVRL